MKSTDALTQFATRLRDRLRRERARPGAPSAGGCSGVGGVEAGGGGWGEEATFNRWAWELFALQYEAVEPLRRWADRCGVQPGGVRDWRELPVLPTAAFKEWEVTSLGPEVRGVVFHSSGTTGQRPSRHAHDAVSLEVYEASLLPWFERHVFAGWAEAGRRVPLLSLTPSPGEAPHSSLAHMAGTAIRELGGPGSGCLGKVDGAGAWTVEARELEAVVRGVGEGPVVLLGTAFSLVQVFDQGARERLDLRLPAGSRVMETGGYKGRARALPKAELLRRLAEVLGVPRAQVVSEYGMSELSSQAYDGVAGPPLGAEPRRFRFPPWARAAVVSPETGREAGVGEAGLLRVVDLANVRSVLAVQTEDVAVRWEDGFELRGRAAEVEPRGCSLMAA